MGDLNLTMEHIVCRAEKRYVFFQCFFGAHLCFGSSLRDGSLTQMVSASVVHNHGNNGRNVPPKKTCHFNEVYLFVIYCYIMNIIYSCVKKPGRVVSSKKDRDI